MSIKDLIVRNQRNNEVVESDSFFPFSSFSKDINRMFEDFFGDFGSLSNSFFRGDRSSFFTPKVNVSENDEQIDVSAELPGMDEKDIQVSLSENILTIKGEKKKDEEKKGKDFHHIERNYGSFQRTIKMPSEIVNDKIKASFKNGVLNVILPKSEKAKDKVRTIKVNAS